MMLHLRRTPDVETSEFTHRGVIRAGLARKLLLGYGALVWHEIGLGFKDATHEWPQR
jgi:hypothetical protein